MNAWIGTVLTLAVLGALAWSIMTPIVASAPERGDCVDRWNAPANRARRDEVAYSATPEVFVEGYFSEGRSEGCRYVFEDRDGGRFSWAADRVPGSDVPYRWIRFAVRADKHPELLTWTRPNAHLGLGGMIVVDA